jgi:hypothetical protein
VGREKSSAHSRNMWTLEGSRGQVPGHPRYKWNSCSWRGEDQSICPDQAYLGKAQNPVIILEEATRRLSTVLVTGQWTLHPFVNGVLSARSHKLQSASF